jgi:hypothetical protein
MQANHNPDSPQTNHAPHTPSTHLTRRQALLTGLAGLAALGPAASAAARDATDADLIEVWKSPTCGCCSDWVQHLRDNGFRTRQTEVDDTAPMRAQLGVDVRYASCHTARIGGYAIEGHVPAADIRRLLKQRPKAIGLAVPNMQIGSPGMDGPAYAGRHAPYDVLLLTANGGTRVFQHHV